MISAVFPFPAPEDVFDESVPPELAASFMPLLTCEFGWAPAGVPPIVHFVLPDYRVNQLLTMPGEHGATPFLLQENNKYAPPKSAPEWVRMVQKPDDRVAHHRATYEQCREKFLDDRAGFAREILESVQATLEDELPAWLDPDLVPHTPAGQPMRFLGALSPDWFVDIQAVLCLFYGNGMVKQVYVS